MNSVQLLHQLDCFAPRSSITSCPHQYRLSSTLITFGSSEPYLHCVHLRAAPFFHLPLALIERHVTLSGHTRRAHSRRPRRTTLTPSEVGSMSGPAYPRHSPTHSPLLSCLFHRFQRFPGQRPPHPLLGASFHVSPFPSLTALIRNGSTAVTSPSTAYGSWLSVCPLPSTPGFFGPRSSMPCSPSACPLPRA